MKYDEAIRKRYSDGVADLIDASGMLNKPSRTEAEHAADDAIAKLHRIRAVAYSDSPSAMWMREQLIAILDGK